MKKKETITISLEPKTLDIIRDEALREYRTINAHIKMIIERHYQEREKDD
jgi:hypothetical protein